jgi:hypothetical protein
MHDHDTKFATSFDQILESANLEVKKTAHRSPNNRQKIEHSPRGETATVQIRCRERLGGRLKHYYRPAA